MLKLPYKQIGNQVILHTTENDILRVAKDSVVNPRDYIGGNKNYPISEEDTDHNHWHGSFDTKQALRWYSTKWPHGNKLAKEVAIKIKPELSRLRGQLALHKKEISSIVGRRINMQAVLEDRPEQWYREQTTDKPLVGDSKFVSAYIQASYNCWTSVKDVVRFGLTLAETVAALETYNIARFQLTLVYDLSNFANNNKLLILVPFKKYFQTLPKNRFICALAAPFFFRRFVLSVMDTMADILKPSSYSYGIPSQSSEETQSKINRYCRKAPVNAFYTLNGINSNPCLETILSPLCQTKQQQERLKALISSKV